MDTPALKLSILDQSPMAPDETAADAFRHTVELAQMAEEWGYHRFWVAEHHGSNRIMGSSPEVLVSHLLAKTSRIRIGSGGVMLQHYSPYKVAENFNVLASLAPGRVDLGIGRGPGGLPDTTRALQQDRAPEAMPLQEKLLELQRFLHNQLEESHPLHGLRTSPVPPQPADLFLLGTTAASGEMAASLGMPYVFALFLNSDEAVMREAVETYRRQSDAGGGARLQPILALPVIVADTDIEAESLAAEIKVVRIRLASGRAFTVGTVEAAGEFARQAGEDYTVDVRPSSVIHGSGDTVRCKLEAVRDQYRVDEIIAVTAIREFHRRLRSYHLLAGAFAHEPEPQEAFPIPTPPTA
jgi:luciferase family oxidoreductase group 1